MTLTPKQLQQLRLERNVKLQYIGRGIGLHPEILEDIEEGRISAMTAVLDAWEKTIRNAPKCTLIESIEFNAATILVVTMLLAAFVLLTLWVLR